MADDSLEIEEEFDFHPCNAPYSMKNYVLADLTAEQQIKLNALKINTVRDNQKYLAAHPEVKAILVIIFKILLKERPLRNPHLTIGKYFTKPSIDIRDEIAEYLEKRKGIISVNSTIIPEKTGISTIYSLLGEEEETRDFEMLPGQSETLSEEYPDDNTEKTTSSLSVAKLVVEDILEKTFIECIDDDNMITEEGSKTPSTEHPPTEEDPELYVDNEEMKDIEKSITSYLTGRYYFSQDEEGDF